MSFKKFGFKNQHQTATTGGCDCTSARLNAEIHHVGLGIPYTNKARNLLPKYALHNFRDEEHGSFNLPDKYGNVVVKFKPEIKKRTTWHYRDSLANEGPLRTHNIRAVKGETCGMYCESQVWGELEVSDAESISIPADMKITSELKSLGLPMAMNERENIGSMSGIRGRILAELGTRTKDLDVQKFLLKIFNEDKSTEMKALALNGMSHLPWKDLKPMVLELFKMPGMSPYIISTLAALARSHRDDPEIAEAFNKYYSGNDWIDIFKTCKEETLED